MCFPEKHRKKSSEFQRAICVPKIAHEFRPEIHSESKIVPNSRERGQKSLKLTELPEPPDDTPSEILRERPSKRKAPGNAPQERVLFLDAPRPHPVIILWITILNDPYY